MKTHQIDIGKCVFNIIQFCFCHILLPDEDSRSVEDSIEVAQITNVSSGIHEFDGFQTGEGEEIHEVENELTSATGRIVDEIVTVVTVALAGKKTEFQGLNCIYLGKYRSSDDCESILSEIEKCAISQATVYNLDSLKLGASRP